MKKSKKELKEEISQLTDKITLFEAVITLANARLNRQEAEIDLLHEIIHQNDWRSGTDY